MILALHAIATAFMTGVIWWVQLVQYPLFDRADATAFPAFHREYTRRVSWVVGPAMTLEAVTGIALLGMNPSDSLLWLGALLLGILWGSTAFLQVPIHRQLERGFQRRLQQRLVSTNWLRTITWSARAGLVCYWLLAGGMSNSTNQNGF